MPQKETQSERTELDLMVQVNYSQLKEMDDACLNDGTSTDDA